MSPHSLCPLFCVLTINTPILDLTSSFSFYYNSLHTGDFLSPHLPTLLICPLCCSHGTLFYNMALITSFPNLKTFDLLLLCPQGKSNFLLVFCMTFTSFLKPGFQSHPVTLSPHVFYHVAAFLKVWFTDHPI